MIQVPFDTSLNALDRRPIPKQRLCLLHAHRPIDSAKPNSLHRHCRLLRSAHPSNPLAAERHEQAYPSRYDYNLLFLDRMPRRSRDLPCKVPKKDTLVVSDVDVLAVYPLMGGGGLP